MTDLPDSLMDATTPAMLAPAAPRKCRRHVKLRVHFCTDPDGLARGLWHVEQPHTGAEVAPCEPGVICTSCWRRLDPDRIRRGRTNLRAGKDAERAIAKAYPGGTRTGHFGGPDDVIVGDLFIVQSKAGRTWFRAALWDELAKLPRTGGRIPTLIVSDRPGPGHRTRRLVIRLMDDDLDLHGEALAQLPVDTERSEK